MLVWRQPLCCCRQSGRVSRGERDRFRKAPLSPRLPAPRLPFIAGSAVSAGGARPSPVDPIGWPRNSPLRTSGQTARSSSRCQRPRQSRESRPPLSPPLPPLPKPGGVSVPPPAKLRARPPPPTNRRARGRLLASRLAVRRIKTAAKPFLLGAFSCRAGSRCVLQCFVLFFARMRLKDPNVSL